MVVAHANGNGSGRDVTNDGNGSDRKRIAATVHMRGVGWRVRRALYPMPNITLQRRMRRGTSRRGLQ